MTTLRKAFLACALLAVSACDSLTKSPTDGIAFQAPQDWTGTPSILGVEAWSSPDNREFLVLMVAPDAANLDQQLSIAQLRNARVAVQKDVTICGNLPAHYVDATVYWAKVGKDMHLEMLATKGNNGRIAMYLFPVGAKPNASTERSIRELCPAKS